MKTVWTVVSVVPFWSFHVFWGEGACFHPPALQVLQMPIFQGGTRPFQRWLSVGYCPHCTSWIIFLFYFYIALNMTTNIDWYRVGAAPKLSAKILLMLLRMLQMPARCYATWLQTQLGMPRSVGILGSTSKMIMAFWKYVEIRLIVTSLMKEASFWEIC